MPRPSNLPKPSPYTLLEYEEVEDLSTWRLWWDFNKDRFLDLANLSALPVTTGVDELSPGPMRIERRGGRAAPESIQSKIVPALLESVKRGGSNEFVQNAMLAMAKIGGEENARQFEFVLRYFLSHGQPVIHQTSALALGLFAGDRAYPVLSDLARDTAAGRALAGEPNEPVDEAVDHGVRAFAAYGLGFVGRASKDAGLRKRIVEDLVALLEEKDHATEDVHVAAMVALGLVPLPVVEGANACYCGTCKVEGPSTSLQAQVTYLMRYFTDRAEFSTVSRAHTATTLARLIEADPPGMPSELELGVAEILVDALERGAREDETVRESAVLALGLVGDAGEEAVDEWIRWALGRAARSRAPMEQRFALIALAQVGSRAGQGDRPFAAAESVQKDLLHHLASAKKDVRPWAGLALGVLGHGLREHGQPLSPAADQALRNMLRTARTADDLGAYAIAIGLRGDQQGAELLIEKLETIEDEDARAYVALGLGLSGTSAAIAPLENALLAEADEPLLESQAGLALGLLGERGVIDPLLSTLQESKSSPTRAAIAQALGFLGDRRSVDTLVGLLDEQESATADPVRTRAIQALGFLSDRAMAPWRLALTASTNYRAETPTLTCGDRTGVLDLN